MKERRTGCFAAACASMPANGVQAGDNGLKASIVPGDMRAGNEFGPPVHWWPKQYLLSAGRPEIPRDFRRAQPSSFNRKMR